MNGREPPGCSVALFPPRDDRAAWDDWLTRELAGAHQRVAEGPATPTLDLGSFRRQLAGFDFSAPRPLVELLSWTIAQLEHGIVHLTHPCYFGLFNPAPTFPAQCADRIAATFNPQLATATTSPTAVEIEGHVIRSVASRAGLPAEAGGHFTNAGSEANYTALICALTMLAAQPAQAQSYTILHNFSGGLDGSYPTAGLTLLGTGNLFGGAGPNAVFRLRQTGLE